MSQAVHYCLQSIARMMLQKIVVQSRLLFYLVLHEFWTASGICFVMGDDKNFAFF